MLLILAFSAVAAQPFTGRLYATGPYGPAYGPGKPGPYYAYPQRSNFYIPSQAEFDLYAADEGVRAAQLTQRGFNVYYNVGVSTFLPNTILPVDRQQTLTRYGSSAKAAGNFVTEQLIQDKIDYFRATHKQPYSQEDRQTLDDLRLQLDAARDQKNRRITQSFPTGFGKFANGAKFSTYFDRQSKESSLTLAENRLDDARKDYAKDPSQENRLDLVNARDARETAEDRRDATTWELMGKTVPFGGFTGQLLRKKATGTVIEIGERNLRKAQTDYAKSPSQDTYDKLRLAKLYLRAAEDDDDATSKDFLVSAVMNPFVTHGKLSHDLVDWSEIMSGVSNDQQSRLWVKYARVQQQIAERKFQEARRKTDKAAPTPAPAAPANDVSTRLVAMSMYGRQPLPPARVY